MDINKEFKLYAVKHKGISSMTFDRYSKFTGAKAAYINPTIIEERAMNVAQMDVFSRLMMERIIFLGTPIDDDVANIIQAQLLFLESVDSQKIFKFTSTLRAVTCMQVSEYTTRCNIYSLMWQRYAQDWLLRWVPFCFVQERKRNVPHWNIRE